MISQNTMVIRSRGKEFDQEEVSLITTCKRKMGGNADRRTKFNAVKLSYTV